MLKNDLKYSQKKSLKSKIFFASSGGIALNAVYAMDDLNVYETTVLIFIGANTDFREQEIIYPSIRKKDIQNATKISRATLTRVLCQLVSKSYLYIQNNSDENGYDVESTYFLTDYLFSEYAKKWYAMFGEAHREPPGGSQGACYYTSVAIPSEVAPPFSEEKEKEKNTAFNKPCGSRAEGEGLSPRQIDAVPPDSPKANTAHDELEDIFPPYDIRPKTQFGKRIEKAKHDNPDLKFLKVTESHRKMVMMFKPDPRLKSFVRDNEIYFMTDQVLEMYGHQGHAIIEKLFIYFKENSKCGQMAWNVNTVWDLIRASKTTIEKGNSK
jgi:hypothetical protein